MNARGIITEAYELLNRLSPGEALSADDCAFGLRRLNSLVDEWGAQAQFLARSVTTAVAQTGDITLGQGDWAAIPAGTQVFSAVASDPVASQASGVVYDGGSL